MVSQEIVNMCGYGIQIEFLFSGLIWLHSIMHATDVGHSCFENEFKFKSIPVKDNRLCRA